MLTTSRFPDALDTRIMGVFDKDLDDLSTLDKPLETLFEQKESNKAYEIMSTIGALPDISQFTGIRRYGDVTQGYDTQLNQVQFAGGMMFERLLKDTMQYGTIDDLAQALSEATWRTIAKDAISIFTDAFTVAGPNITGTGGNFDALSLCNSAHTTNVPGGTTFSNTGTTAISATQIETERQNGMLTRNDINEISPILFDLIIGGPGIEETAYEVINSMGKVQTANNNRNFHYGKYNLYISPFFGTSTDWFFVSTRHMRKWLKWFWLTRPEFKRDSEFDSLVFKYGVYWARSKGWTEWRWLRGNNL